MFNTIPESTRELAERAAARRDITTVQLNDEEFGPYVIALRNFWRKAVTERDGGDDWSTRMLALDILFGVRTRVGADSVDTAHLRECWKSRRLAATFDETFGVGMAGPSARTIVLALAEYVQSEPEDVAGGAFRIAATGVLGRIEEQVR